MSTRIWVALVVVALIAAHVAVVRHDATVVPAETPAGSCQDAQVGLGGTWTPEGWSV